MYKVPVIIKEDYIVFFEPSKYGVLVHCDIKTRWSKEVKLQLQKDWYQLRELHSNNRMIALHFEDQGTKHIKFLEMMGFRYHQDNDEFKVYIIGE